MGEWFQQKFSTCRVQITRLTFNWIPIPPPGTKVGDEDCRGNIQQWRLLWSWSYSDKNYSHKTWYIQQLYHER